MKQKKYLHTINGMKLIKLERFHNNPSKKLCYWYELDVEGMEEHLIFTSNEPIKSNEVVGLKFKFEMNPDTNEITKFEFV